MEPNSLKWVGSSCGLHGPYVFYKAFRFHRDGRTRILSLGDFFLVRCQPGDPICIAELQLLWEERTTQQLLSSSKLYFLPEDTPNGRNVSHGEDEVIAVSEKVILRLEDLVKWTVWDFSGWAQGKQTVPSKVPILKELDTNGGNGPHLHRGKDPSPSSGLNFKDVQREKAQIGEDEDDNRRTKVLVLSYPQYCRHRCVLARLRGHPAGPLSERVIRALGGLVSLKGDTRVLYCKETFQHPTLGHNESVCDHFAPNLKGRPRKKKLSISQRRDSQNHDHTQTQTLKQSPQTTSESNSPEPKLQIKVKANCRTVMSRPKNGGIGKRASTEEGTGETQEKGDAGSAEECGTEEQAFLVALYKYMKERKTPIERIPYLGFKQINLWTMFQAAQKLGGYEMITAHRQWKHVYDELGGNPGSTSAATCTRRHYEKLLLPYERHTKGEDDRPLPMGKTRKHDPGEVTEGGRVRGLANKRPKTGQSQEQLSRRDKDPHSTVSSDSSENWTTQESVQVKGEQRNIKGEEEEEEELQLTVKKEMTLNDKNPLPHLHHHDNNSPKITEWDNQAHLENPVLNTLGKVTDRDRPNGMVPKASSLSSYPNWQCTKPGHISPLPFGTVDAPVARETQLHGDVVGLTASAVKPGLPNQDGIVSGLQTNNTAASNGGEVCGTPLNTSLHPKIYPGVMSPLAKKKLLSQVSERGLTVDDCTFVPPFPPSATMRKSTVSGASCSEDPVKQRLNDSSSPETALLTRPSVIQHAHKLKKHWSSGESRATGEPGRPDTFSQNVSQLQSPFQSHPHAQPLRSSSRDSFLHRMEAQGSREEPGENHKVPPLQEPVYVGDFYSSSFMHNLYGHAGHQISKTYTPGYLNRENQARGSDRNCKNLAPKPCDATQICYTPPPLGEQNRASPQDTQFVDEPTDLSLPKISQPKPLMCGPHRPTILWDSMANSVSLSGQPVVPGIPGTPKKLALDTSQNLGGWSEGGNTGHKVKQDRGYSTEEVKTTSQLAGAARHLKRSLEEPGNAVVPDRKIRAVSPLPASRDWGSSVSQTAEPEVETVKSAEPAVHLNSYTSDGHKYPLPTPLLGGLYPAGTFAAHEVCERGLSLALAQPHPLALLKGQTTMSPLMASPFTLNALMMQRHLLSTPHQLYRPLPNSVTPYRDLLSHGLYSLSPLNPHPPYTPLQLPSVQPGTKL
ncbi:AT-rich interactive domain-containing protein 5B [Chanos chanos]|uniref:AT-rich interactive domain-containing protein 5B n=1 Tax=Chanos chanos TaxID=29144 RepID=A0A6J2WBD7_CHACN|nr:AT-rich interactive domain-containing protein 5B-like [Chanos chanos]